MKPWMQCPTDPLFEFYLVYREPLDEVEIQWSGISSIFQATQVFLQFRVFHLGTTNTIKYDVANVARKHSSGLFNIPISLSPLLQTKA